MARANLSLDSEVSAAFLAAQDDVSVRALQVAIQGETLVLHNTIRRGSDSVQRDFDDAVRGALHPTEASLVLMRLNDEGLGRARWMLLSWVPDGCRVRDKMLYSSSREDLKRSLGIGYFDSEYFSNSAADLNWEAYLSYVQQRGDGRSDAQLLSERERLVLAEKAMSHGESSTTKAAAMTRITFPPTEEAARALAAFSSGASAPALLELDLVNEHIHVTRVEEEGVARGDLQKFVRSDDARFYIIRVPSPPSAVSLFVYLCPDSAAVRRKMTLSSAKASVISSANEMGIVFDRTIEIRGADEMDEAIEAACGSGAGEAAGGSSAAANIAHSKPSRPGRGKAKAVAKFDFASVEEDA